MTSPGGVALACVRCEYGYWVLILSHLRAEPMSNEKLDAVRDLLMSDDNAEILEKFSSVWLEDPEQGAEMIISFASDKGLKLDATADEVVDHLEKLDEDLDIELTPEMLANVAGGRRSGLHASDRSHTSGCLADPHHAVRPPSGW